MGRRCAPPIAPQLTGPCPLPDHGNVKATYRAIQLKGQGGLDQLQEVELPFDPPKQGEIRIRVRASGVGSTDFMKLLEAGGLAGKIVLWSRVSS